MTNLRDHIIEWLDEIGADGLMKPDWEDGPIAITPDDIMRDKDAHLHLQLVPAFRHADGSYHTEPEHWFLCKTCICDCMPIGDDACGARFDAHECAPYQSWLAHKEAAK